MVSLLMCAVLLAPEAAQPQPTSEQIRFFEANIRPLLAEKCLKCHGGRKQWGGLRLDSREALMKGGESGAAIIPGNPDESLLIELILETDKDVRMPKDGQLTKRQIDDLGRWIEMGAPYPASTTGTQHKRDPNHWAFHPPKEQPLPNVKNSNWPQTPIDHFILATLEAAGITPTPRADRRTLIRRVTFDLIGLPPTPQEIDAFLADESPGAFVRVVDRLLASQRYGERWGRHWLDVARFADSNGFDENIAHANAWRYRDYVVESFNRDKPFDRFVTEQLAGDLLPFDSETQQHEQLIATGFLSIGPKVLAETDQAKMRMDIIDEQIDTTGRAFMALTLGCARCHDHKFDPIDTADYYGLAGIFKSTLTMTKYTKVAEWHEHLLPSAEAKATKAAFEARIAAKKKAIAELEGRADSGAGLQPARNKQQDDKAGSKPAPQIEAQLKKLKEELAALEKEGPNLPSAMGVTEDKIVDVAIHLRGDPLKLGEVVPRHAPPVLRGPHVPEFSDKQSGRRELADWLVDPNHPLTARVIVNRVWRWHFGKGLVRSIDNFGLLGERPSHPELLDWLARRFVADGWSIKSLHRMIVMSSTYQQSSNRSRETSGENESLTTSAAGDPDNRLFSRADVRRLEAEAIRDAILATSGQLDTTMGGSLLKLKNRAYFFDHTSKDLTTYDSRRRSLYLPVVRNHVYSVFQLLDFPDPAVTSGDRATTVVASQALLMLNSDIVMQAAGSFAERLIADLDNDDLRLTRLYAIAFGRPPTPDERLADLAFLNSVEQAQSNENADMQRKKAWSTLCHVVLASNEFLYVR